MNFGRDLGFYPNGKPEIVVSWMLPKDKIGKYQNENIKSDPGIVARMGELLIEASKLSKI